MRLNELYKGFHFDSGDIVKSHDGEVGTVLGSDAKHEIYRIKLKKGGGIRLIHFGDLKMASKEDLK